MSWMTRLAGWARDVVIADFSSHLHWTCVGCGETGGGQLGHLADIEREYFAHIDECPLIDSYEYQITTPLLPALFHERGGRRSTDA